MGRHIRGYGTKRRPRHVVDGRRGACVGGGPKMRVLGLVLAGGLVATASMSAHAVPLGSDAERLATVAAPGIVQAWDGCGWGWHPVPGHWSQRRGDGFRRIVRRTATTGAGTLMRVGKAPLKDGVITAAGEARTG